MTSICHVTHGAQSLSLICLMPQLDPAIAIRPGPALGKGNIGGRLGRHLVEGCRHAPLALRENNNEMIIFNAHWRPHLVFSV